MSSVPNGALTGGTYDFSALAPGAYTSFTGQVGGVSFLASALYDGGDARLVRSSPANYGPGFWWGDHLLFASGIEGLRLDFGAPLGAFGIGAIGNITGGYAITVSLFDGDTLLGSLSAGGVAGWQGNTGVTFVAAQSTQAFDRVEVRGPAYGFATNGFVMAPAAPVPEPASVLMMAVGGLALWLDGRRRRLAH
ncbi:MAG: PEP-CTERM sorting domain-containing protein [Roseateles sp.]